MKKPISPTQKMLNAWAIVLIIWSAYRTIFKTDLPVWFDEFIAKPAIFLLPVFYFITKIEKKNIFEGIDLRFKTLPTDILIGIGMGLIFLLTGIITFGIKNQALPSGIQSLALAPFLSILVISIASSVSEEILSRGFVLKRLYEESRNAISSVFFASFLFFFLHIPILFSNPQMRGNVLLQVMATDILLSFAVSFMYLQRRNIVIPILIHAFYNLSIYLFV